MIPAPKLRSVPKGFSKRLGLSLVELVVSIAIISISVAGTLLVIQVASKFDADPMVARQATSLADGYLSEIYTKSFPSTYPCPAPSASRANYSNVCDYQGLVNTPPQDQNGNLISNLSGYTVSVSIDGAAASLGTLSPGTQVVRIDVTVTHKLMPTLVISEFRTNH